LFSWGFHFAYRSAEQLEGFADFDHSDCHHEVVQILGDAGGGLIGGFDNLQVSFGHGTMIGNGIVHVSLEFVQSRTGDDNFTGEVEEFIEVFDAHEHSVNTAILIGISVGHGHYYTPRRMKCKCKRSAKNASRERNEVERPDF
jgi:hypothetical protein